MEEVSTWLFFDSVPPQGLSVMFRPDGGNQSATRQPKNPVEFVQTDPDIIKKQTNKQRASCLVTEDVSVKHLAYQIPTLTHTHFAPFEVKKHPCAVEGKIKK